jgi:hypothetical protein
VAVVLLLRDSDRNTDYKQGDVVAVIDPNDNLSIPPGSPFWLMRVEGLSVADAMAYAQPEYTPQGTLKNKRPWGIIINKMAVDKRTFLTTNRFIGFGLQPYLTQFGVTVPVILTDIILQWSEVRLWMTNKNTGGTA